MIKARISIPNQIRLNDTIEIKTLVSHPMESGFRLNHNGDVIPRNLIEKFEVLYEGRLVFGARFGPGIAANPFLSFSLVATEAGPIEFVWYEQNGDVTRLTRQIELV